MNFKKILSLFLVVFLIIGTVPTTAFAEEPGSGISSEQSNQEPGQELGQEPGQESGQELGRNPVRSPVRNQTSRWKMR